MHSIKRYRFGLVIGLLAACVAVLAQQAMDPDESLLEMMTPDSMETGTMSAMSSSLATVPDQIPVILASQLPAHNPAVGKLVGQASTSGGAASYNIPIVVPPGRRGMQPDLALADAAGPVMEWWMVRSFSGLSAITRLSSHISDAGRRRRAVALGAGDKLCLDGQRLVATAGTYGQFGAVYQPNLKRLRAFPSWVGH